MLIRAYAFSKMRGAAPMKVGLKTARLSTIRSIRPSTAVEKPICSGRISRIFPNTCESGSQRNWRSSSLRRDTESTPAPS